MDNILPFVGTVIEIGIVGWIVFSLQNKNQLEVKKGQL